MMQQIREGVYSPEIHQQYEAKVKWAENALKTIENEIYDYGVETVEYYQCLDNANRVQQALEQARRNLADYRECTCGSGYIWHQCSGHPETGTTYCG